MQIQPDHLRKRLELLRQDRERLRSNLDALSGAIDDCLFWLSILAKPEPEPEKEQPAE